MTIINAKRWTGQWSWSTGKTETDELGPRRPGGEGETETESDAAVDGPPATKRQQAGFPSARTPGTAPARRLVRFRVRWSGLGLLTPLHAVWLISTELAPNRKRDCARMINKDSN
jgi:hypothetical protein